MKAEAIYKDIDGNDCNIWQMLKREPDWAASRILLGELAINRLKELGEWPLKKKESGMQETTFGKWCNEETDLVGIEENMKEKCESCGCEMVIDTWGGWRWACFGCDTEGRQATEEEIEHQEEEYLNRGENGISAT